MGPTPAKRPHHEDKCVSGRRSGLRDWGGLEGFRITLADCDIDQPGRGGSDCRTVATGTLDLRRRTRPADEHSRRGPIAGPHNFYRGGSLKAYDHEMQIAISKIENARDKEIATQLWQDALSSEWQKAPVWVHGDFAIGNILIENGRLKAIIDFGQLAIGDPACDLVIAWNFFSDESREIFKETVQLDKNTWIRALGWAFWKTLCWPVKGTDVQPLLNIIYQEYQKLKS